MPENYVQAERFEGEWAGMRVAPKRVWGGHRFTDEECAELLADGLIVLEDLTSARTGAKYSVRGRLAHQTFTGDDGKAHHFVGFQPVDFSKTVPTKWGGHTFTREEVDQLNSGVKVKLDDCVSKDGNPFQCEVKFDKWDGIIPEFPPR